MSPRTRVGRADFQQLRKSARRVRGQFFMLLAGAQLQRYTRFTCVVSKKVASKAHERNAIKRRCREAARVALKEAPPRVLAFHALRSAHEASFFEIEKDVQKLIESLRS